MNDSATDGEQRSNQAQNNDRTKCNDKNDPNKRTNDVEKNDEKKNSETNQIVKVQFQIGDG